MAIRLGDVETEFLSSKPGAPNTVWSHANPGLDAVQLGPRSGHLVGHRILAKTLDCVSQRTADRY